jgi:hypothetical protein
MIGLASGTLIDPLAVMALIAGDTALSGPEATTPTKVPTPSGEPLIGAGPFATVNPAPASSAGEADARGAFDPTSTSPAQTTTLSSLDVSDLSFADPAQLAPPVLALASTGTTGGSGRGADAWTPDAPVSPPAGGFEAGTTRDDRGSPTGPSVTALDGSADTTTPKTAADVGAPPGADTATIHSAVGNATVKLDGHGHALTGLTSTVAPAVLASRPSLPYGMFGFTVNGVRPHEIASVDLTLPAGSNPNGYYKQDPATGALSRFDFDGHTGAVVHGNTITLYLQDGGRGDDDGQVNGTIVDPGGPGEDPDSIIAAAQVREVTFSGPDLITIDADPGTPAYPNPPHWLDTDLNGVIDAPGDRSLPTGYPRDTNAVVSAHFTAYFADVDIRPRNYELMVRGLDQEMATLPSFFNVPATPVLLDGTDLYLPPTTVYNPFPGVINYGTLAINWEFSNDGGMTWSPAGHTQNELYVTLGTPQVAPVYESLIWLGCSVAYGMTDAPTTVDKIWKPFSDRAVKTEGGDQLYYYKNWHTPSAEVADLLKNKDGRCMAWTKYFLTALAAQGIAEKDNYVIIAPKAGNGSMLLVANWDFVGHGTSGDTKFPYKNTLKDPKDVTSYEVEKTDKSWSYEWGATEEVKDKPGIAGQGTDNPRAMFSDHVVAQFEGKIYDPSYGRKFDTLQDLEDAELVGFGAPDVVAGTTDQFFWTFKKNPAGADVNARTKTYPF